MTIKEATDYTGLFGPLYPQDTPAWPMYSFSRPAVSFWNGAANELKHRGFTDSKIRDWLQSKNTRWMLDAYEVELEILGAKLVREWQDGY